MVLVLILAVSLIVWAALYVAGAPLTPEETAVIVGIVALLVWAVRSIIRRGRGGAEERDEGK